jgi:hypothetical protein
MPPRRVSCRRAVYRCSPSPLWTTTIPPRLLPPRLLPPCLFPPPLFPQRLVRKTCVYDYFHDIFERQFNDCLVRLCRFQFQFRFLFYFYFKRASAASCAARAAAADAARHSALATSALSTAAAACAHCSSALRRSSKARSCAGAAERIILMMPCSLRLRAEALLCVCGGVCSVFYLRRMFSTESSSCKGAPEGVYRLRRRVFWSFSAESRGSR